MQVKKLGYILFVGVIATICILPVAVMPWQTEKAVGNEQLASFPELRKEDGSFNTGILNEFSDYFADRSTRKIRRQTKAFLYTAIPLASICILSWHRATATPVSPGICPTV